MAIHGPERSPLWLCRLDRLTNYESLITSQPLTFHFSPIPSPLTSHGRASGLAVRLQDLFLILSECVDLGLLSITAPFRATRDLTGRFVLVLVVAPRPRIRPRGVMEYWSVGCCANSELHPRSGLGMLKKILGSRFEIIRINQCESARSSWVGRTFTQHPRQPIQDKGDAPAARINRPKARRDCCASFRVTEAVILVGVPVCA